MEFMLPGRINPALVKLIPTINVCLYFYHRLATIL